MSPSWSVYQTSSMRLLLYHYYFSYVIIFGDSIIWKTLESFEYRVKLIVVVLIRYLYYLQNVPDMMLLVYRVYRKGNTEGSRKNWYRPSRTPSQITI